MALYHESLDVDDYEIRMLTILPGSPGSIVRCTMQKTNLINPIKYAALSYCWGDETVTTDIFVNEIEIQVTVNLADALQRLRKLGVCRLWVDALCINQSDKQEKGLQIRNMKHIYSKAEMTYGWLGREGDGIKTIFTFLISLLDPSSNISLAPTSHTCKRPNHQNPSQSEDCQRCMLETSMQGLRRILECQYWKRRWIIQETSASYREILLCGDATITLDEMDRVVSLCRQPRYWTSEVAKVFSWFETIIAFRRLYQENARPSLCRAIGLSRKFESTDPRDAIFSLLGVCHDGSELVPTPTYSQPVILAVRDLTRALIWKLKCLDFILIKGMHRVDRTGLDSLSSWAPDWLSGYLPPQAYELADKHWIRDRPRFCLGDAIDRNFSLGQDEILRVQGILIGRVATSTSTTNPSDDVSLLYPYQPIGSVSLTDSHDRSYYTKKQVLTAIMTCLSRHFRFPERDWIIFHKRSNIRIIWHTFCLRLTPDKSQSSHLNAECDNVGLTKAHSRRMILQWLETNAMFNINGKTLKGWIKEENYTLAPLLRAFDSILAMILPVLLIWAPPLFVIYYWMRDRIRVINNTPVVAILPVIIGCSYVISTGVIYRFLEYRQWRMDSKQHWDDLSHLVSPGKKLIVADKGFLALVDDRAMVGDMLFNLVGCPESVVLRKVESSGKRYVLVGNCYVHLTPEDQYEYFGPDRGGHGESNLREVEERVEWLNEPRNWKEIELI